MESKRNAPPRETLSKRNLLFRGVPQEYVNGTIDDYVQDNEIKKMIQNYLVNMHDMFEDKINLCLYGSNGSGKSFLASLIVKEAYRLRYNSYMLTLASLIDVTFKPNKTDEDWEVINAVKNAHFLVIDEVGKENFNKSLSNVNLLEETLRGATKKGQVVILCTNSHLEDLYDRYGASIQSLIEGNYIKIKFDKDDYRKNVMKRKRAISLLLGE